MFKCGTCNQNFNYKKNVQRHIQNVHILKTTYSECSPKIKEGKYKCFICQHVFVAKFSLERHQKVQHKIYTFEQIRKSK